MPPTASANTASAHLATPAATGSLADRFQTLRAFTESLCEPLETEDFVIQSMPDVSPTKWHLAHTTWFFETFLLKSFQPNYQPRDDDFAYLFNSYYNTVGAQFPRSQRGWLSRPTVKEVWQYRHRVEEDVVTLLSNGASDEMREIAELGIQHEQQHQELIISDIKHVLSCNPRFPAYQSNSATERPTAAGKPKWKQFDGGVHGFGANSVDFCFDNERPQFEFLLAAYQLQDRLITNGEYLAFVREDGYQRPEFWLSLGWTTQTTQQWASPLYWVEQGGEWYEFTLHGLEPIDWDAPVCHVSYFEADAYARWRGMRLPTELEWEHAAVDQQVRGNLAEQAVFHPLPAEPSAGAANEDLRQLYGDVWEWTSSPYTAYPGYQSPQGAFGEYNGKFMCNQFVLRGGSCGTPGSHLRATYRNFFPPEARWQFSGIRLAQ